DFTLGLVVAHEGDLAGHLGDDRVLLRLTRLEQLGDTRQTAGNITRTRGFPRHAGEHFTGLDLLPILDRDDCSGSEAIDARFLRFLASEGEPRVWRVLFRLGIVVGDDALRDTGRLVDLLRHRPVLDQVLVLYGTCLLGNDRAERGVPLGDTITAAD